MAYKKMNKEELFTENRRYVEAVAKQYLNQGLTLEQLIEEGNKGLVYAAEHYYTNGGHPFLLYASRHIHHTIRDALLAISKDEPLSKKLSILLDTKEYSFIIHCSKGKDIDTIVTDMGMPKEVVLQICHVAIIKIQLALCKNQLGDYESVLEVVKSIR